MVIDPTLGRRRRSHDRFDIGRPAPATVIPLAPAIQAATVEKLPKLSGVKNLADLGKVAEIQINGQTYEVILGLKCFAEFVGHPFIRDTLKMDRDFQINQFGLISAVRTTNILEGRVGVKDEGLLPVVNKALPGEALRLPTIEESYAIASALEEKLSQGGMTSFWTGETMACSVPAAPGMLRKIKGIIGQDSVELDKSGRKIVSSMNPRIVITELPGTIIARLQDTSPYPFFPIGIEPSMGVVLIRAKNTA
ncbi:MAG: hypothetical protein NT099_06760 [Candidatus Saganbacteria bacterium]|nr:hypothetical protein [Candidatus Saganbacteria bacterium]